MRHPVLGWHGAAYAASCPGTGASCRDDSGPNLLVRGVQFLLLVTIVAAVVWVVRRVRRRRRTRSGG